MEEAVLFFGKTSFGGRKRPPKTKYDKGHEEQETV
jgi:hypothetical protein